MKLGKESVASCCAAEIRCCEFAVLYLGLEASRKKVRRGDEAKDNSKSRACKYKPEPRKIPWSVLLFGKDAEASNPAGMLTQCVNLCQERRGKRSGVPAPPEGDLDSAKIVERLQLPTHSVCSFGGWDRVCITTQYCSVFSRRPRNCSSVAAGATTSKCRRIFSKPTGTSFEIPRVPRRSRSPSTDTSMRLVGMPMAVATI